MPGMLDIIQNYARNARTLDDPALRPGVSTELGEAFPTAPPAQEPLRDPEVLTGPGFLDQVFSAIRRSIQGRQQDQGPSGGKMKYLVKGPDGTIISVEEDSGKGGAAAPQTPFLQ